MRGRRGRNLEIEEDSSRSKFRHEDLVGILQIYGNKGSPQLRSGS